MGKVNGLFAKMNREDLPVLAFESAASLRMWLIENHTTSTGIWVRVYRHGSGVGSVSFQEILDEGLCFGWSESKRVKGDEISYLQLFTPRRTKGTTSKRNKEHILRLIREKKMTPSGLVVLDDQFFWTLFRQVSGEPGKRDG